MTRPIRVMVVDDQQLVRQGLIGLLALYDDFEVVAQAPNGQEAIHLVEATEIDVVLMDVRMPVMNGIEAAREIVRMSGPPVVLMTTFEDTQEMAAGVSAGVMGFIFKNADVEEIQQALRDVCGGKSVFHPNVSSALARQVQSLSQVRMPTSEISLTAREHEILASLAEGRSNKRIAQQLGITEGTAKIHISNILSKLGANSRLDAVVKAKALGIIV